MCDWMRNNGHVTWNKIIISLAFECIICKLSINLCLQAAHISVLYVVCIVCSSTVWTQWTVNYAFAGLCPQWILQQRIKWAVSQDDGVSQSAWRVHLVHRVPAPAGDQERGRPRVVSWDHFKEVSSQSLSLSAICSSRQGGMWRAMF